MQNKIFKYSIFIVFLGLFLTSCENKKKDKTELEETKATTEKTHSWTDEEKIAFQKNSNGFLIAHAVENPEKYTDCLLKIVIDEYPIPEDAIALGQNELISLFEKSNCLDDLLLIKIVSPWDDEIEQIFLKECLTSAKKKFSTEADAKSYCDCALTEIKKIIPNPQHVITLTDDELSIILKKCK